MTFYDKYTTLLYYAMLIFPHQSITLDVIRKIWKHPQDIILCVRSSYFSKLPFSPSKFNLKMKLRGNYQHYILHAVTSPWVLASTCITSGCFQHCWNSDRGGMVIQIHILVVAWYRILYFCVGKLTFFSRQRLVL